MDDIEDAAVEVRRSRRRTRTVQAFYEDGRIVVAIPDRLSAAEEAQWVDRMVQRLQRSERRRRPSDAGLAARAEQLSRQYLGGRARPRSVSWVSNQRKRWGSCTRETATIRISDEARGMPQWVLDYILLHELAHLLEPGHGPAFQALTDRYPDKSRARGFLDGVSYARQLGLPSDHHGDASDGEVD